jgi:4'-phosphopantetheinyl transferase
MTLPPPGEVHVWSVALDLPDADVGVLGGVLAEDELLRAGRIRSEDGRRRAVVSRASLRALLGRYLGRAPAEIAFAAGPEGKPRLEDAGAALRFNLSHSADLALVAVAREAEVGIDVEHVRPRDDLAGLARRTFAEAEREAIDADGDRDRAFYRHWVAKEAYVKATGHGVRSLRSFEVLLEAPEGARLVHVGGDPAEAARWTLALLEPGEGYVGAVVAEGGVTVGAPRAFDPRRALS